MDEHRPHIAWSPSAAAAPPPLVWHQPHPYGARRAYAGFWRRFVAGTIDGIILGLPITVLSNILDGILLPVVDAAELAGSVWLALSVVSGWLAASLVLLVVLPWLYSAGLESSSWQATLGKQAVGIAVTDLAGDRISFGRATGRYFAHIVSDITLGLGYLIQPFTARRQALHDLIAGTLVVRT